MLHALVWGTMAAMAAGMTGVVPSGAAHQDGCLVAMHVMFVQIHQVCTSNPEACFSNVQASNVDVNLICHDPEKHPCVAKVAALGHHANVCP